MGNKIATFTEQQLNDYQVSVKTKLFSTEEKEFALIVVGLLIVSGLYILYAKRNFKVNFSFA